MTEREEIAKLKDLLKQARDELSSLRLPAWLRPTYFITQIDEALKDE